MKLFVLSLPFRPLSYVICYLDKLWRLMTLDKLKC